MTKTPSADDLHTAAQWLDVYEGADGYLPKLGDKLYLAPGAKGE